MFLRGVFACRKVSHPVCIFVETNAPITRMHSEASSLSSQRRFLFSVSAVRRLSGLIASVCDIGRRSRLSSVISPFLESFPASSMERTQTTPSVVVVFWRSPVSHFNDASTVALPSLWVVLFSPRITNSKHSVDPLLLPPLCLLRLSVHFYFCLFHHFSIFTYIFLIKCGYVLVGVHSTFECLNAFFVTF